MATIHGKGGAVALAPGGSGGAVVGEGRSWRIDLDKEFDEDSAFGDTWRTQLLGLISWSGSVEANFDTAATALFAAATATALSSLYLYPQGTGTAAYYFGQIWPKLSVEVGITGTARATVDFDGDGALSQKA